MKVDMEEDEEDKEYECLEECDKEDEFNVNITLKNKPVFKNLYHKHNFKYINLLYH